MGAVTIALTGGGSGGHITPILAVADELKRQRPDARIVFIGQIGDKLGDVPKAHPSVDDVYYVRAGKLRRYHGQGWKQMFHLPTMAKNIRDGFFLLIGIWQSYKLLKKIQPSVIFVRGSYVGVPVCIAAARQKIPYITHDADSIPNLTNKIIGKNAAAHAVAMPKETYAYPQDKTFQVGIPISDDYQPVTTRTKNEYRKGLNLKEDDKVICVTGGGLGAQRLNGYVCQIVPELLKKYPSLVVFHFAGRKHEIEVNN